MWSSILGAACLFWYLLILVVSAVGYYKIYRHYRNIPRRALSETLPWDQIPHLTVIRPVKGLEPQLYECLASTYRQTYPRDKLTLYLCVSSRDDPALPILNRLVQDFREYDTKVFIEEDDTLLSSSPTYANFGPNPKIRNMSRAYREAKGDAIWIIDCNIWVAKGVAGRMVDTLYGFGNSIKYKFVHQLPIVVDLLRESPFHAQTNSLAATGHRQPHAVSTSTSAYDTLSQAEISEASGWSRFKLLGGTRLEELFLSSSHAKFYTAINTVLIAPCILGKSNMFRRSHLDFLTSDASDGRLPGIDYFSHNICEDHLIGDLLWKSQVPEEVGPKAEHLGKHALVFGDLAIQPMAGMSVSEYIARRVRWLRVRKFTVPAATLVEPGTESLVCSFCGAYAVSSLPWIHETFGIPQSWLAFFVFFALSVSLWALVDRTLYLILHSVRSIQVDENAPDFARGSYCGYQRSFSEWLLAWIGRESLAFPIWVTAVCGGVTVSWRGKQFRVGLDARVRLIDNQTQNSKTGNVSTFSNGASKSRRD